MPLCIAAVQREELPVVRQRMRPGTDDRHIPPEHVDELGQLVDAIAAQEASQPCHTAVILLRLGDRAAFTGRHRAEFVDVEGPTLETATALTEQSWPWAFDAH